MSELDARTIEDRELEEATSARVAASAELAARQEKFGVVEQQLREARDEVQSLTVRIQGLDPSDNGELRRLAEERNTTIARIEALTAQLDRHHELIRDADDRVRESLLLEGQARAPVLIRAGQALDGEVAAQLAAVADELAPKIEEARQLARELIRIRRAAHYSSDSKASFSAISPPIRLARYRSTAEALVETLQRVLQPRRR